MRIEYLQLGKVDGNPRAAARIVWEDCDRTAQQIWFETDEQFADAFACNPHCFLIAGIMPALRHGEHRIKIDAPICPELKGNLIEAMSWFSHWFGGRRKPVKIESPTLARPAPAHPPEAAFLFSGGVDSLATLRANRLNFPREHPGSFRNGILIFGLDVEKHDIFKHVVEALSDVATDAGITLTPVYTNERCLDDDWEFWKYEFQGAALAAAAHSLSRRITSASIGATYDLWNLRPWGSHPVIDPLFSSCDLRIRHDSVNLSRLDKVRLLADWEAGLHGMRVCNKSEKYRARQFNCGVCEKCVRTMMALIAAGALEKCRAFPSHEVSADVIDGMEIGDAFVASCYPELIRPLEECGRADLARAIERLLVRFRREVGFKGALRKFDRRILGGSIFRLKRSLSESAAGQYQTEARSL